MSPEVILTSIFSAAFAFSVLRITTPILLAALGGLLSELAGVINVALEGMMLTAAFVGVVISAYAQDAWLGLLAGVVSAMFMAVALAYFHLNLKADLILAGLAMNILASGATVFLLFALTHDKGFSNALKSLSLPSIKIPILAEIPILGDILSGHNVITYVAFALVAVVWVLLYRTALGVHIRAVGESPDAAASVGIDVIRIKYIALILSGLFSGIGGVNLSMGYMNFFQRDMTAGRGFIALAAVFLGDRNPIGTLLASLVFGFADALSNQLGSLKIPPQLVLMIPYLATIIALAVYAQRKKAIAVEKARKFREKMVQEAAVVRKPRAASEEL
ncbi:MAG: ABC transporter permease [Chloroflexi bacterium]|nr:ABC transporter permease [Chloroflexota bacterium]